MALDRPEVIDAVGIEKETDNVVLTVADSWDWTDEHEHLLALQEKLNAYFRFVESGQIFESYPLAEGRELVIEVVTRWPLPNVGKELLRRASESCCDLGITIRTSYYPGSEQ